MAHFTGFTCDNCGSVVGSEGRTKVTTKIDGPEVQGEYVQDYCFDCAKGLVPEGIALKPLRRRRGADRVQTSQVESRPADGGSDEDTDGVPVLPQP